ncbi:nephrocystin-4-like [Silurus asotus]|uniref:Nephrocystin-4-like n=1 Tax=Silurus asotus TaxID=30991 RepID=A0AAD5FRQ1_SILAS|nr:nephrocystin-4-like [Silurus asotus]
MEDQPAAASDLVEDQPAATSEFVREITAALREAFRPATVNQAPPLSGGPMALPASFSGDAAECHGFLLQVSLYIEMHSHSFPNKRAKVEFLISLLTGRALAWARALWSAASPALTTYATFTSHFTEVFSTAPDQLLNIHQGRDSVSGYSLRFRTLAASAGWNEKALLAVYRRGLNQELRLAMATYDDSLGLEAFIQRSIRVSQHLAAESVPTTAASSTPEPEPMQLCSQRLSRQERERRWVTGACLYCGEGDHRVAQCPVRPPRRTVSTVTLTSDFTHLSTLMVTLVTPSLALSAVTLVDSGSAGNFISQACLERLQLRRQRASQELAVQTIQGRPLGKGKVKYCAPLIVLQVGVLHREEIQLLVLEDSTVDVILGRPWLAKHSPICSWDPCDILEWGPACRQKCLLPLPTPIHKTLTLAATKVEGAPQPVQVDVLREYQAFSDVFSEKAATLLPPHIWYQGPNYLRGGFIPCQLQNTKRWRATSNRPSARALSPSPPPRPLLASFSCQRRTGDCAPASTTGPSMH